MGQQFYVIRRNPAPGTPAYDAWEARRKAHAKHHPQPESNGDGPQPPPRGGGAAKQVPTAVAETPAPRVVRQQPRKQTRSQRKS
jgi:YidC/Oxa1 family membrane protein insertase